MTSAVQQMLDGCRTEGLDKHPFLTGMKNRPPDLGQVHDVMANGYGFASRFCDWLTSLMARVDDVRLRSLLARELNDELGNGDFSKIQLRRYEQMLASLVPHAKSGRGVDAGVALREAAERCFRADNVYEALGAMMAGEIFAVQFDAWFISELERQSQLDLTRCSWYSAREAIDRVNTSERVAELIPLDEAAQAAVVRGGRNLKRAIDTFFDRLGHTAAAAA